MDNTITNNRIRSILLTVLVVLMITAMAGTVSAAITYVTVTSPDGGENVSGTVPLTWDSDGAAGDSGSFTLAYSTDNGTATWKNIIVGLSCDMRSYSWDTTTTTDAGAPAPGDGTNYAFRISYSANVSITDRSDGNFTIDNTAPTLALDLPTVDQNVSTSTVWINGTYTDATSGVNTSSLVVKVNGTAVSGGTTGGTILSGYYNYSIALPDGSHNVTVDVSDYAGKTATQVTRNFKVDTVAPTFTAYTPTDNSNIADKTPWVNAKFADAGTGVNASATTIKVNGTVVTAGESTSAKVTYECPTALADGTIPVNVSITDYMGNTTWGNWTFVVDTVKPTLALDLPTVDQNVSTSTVWINGTYTDATSGVNTSSLVVKVNGTAVSGGTTGGTILSGYYNYSIALPDGSHNVTVDVSDYAGNAATQVTRDFKVDTVAPTFTAYTPTDNSNITDNTPWVNATFADAGTGVNASATTIKVNGTVVTAGESTSAKVTYECPTALDDGTILVNVSITDYMGNTTWGNWTFVVDTVKPTLALDLPTVDQNVSTSTVWINGTYTDATSGVVKVKVKVNGTTVSGGTTGGTILSGYYNYSIALPDGSHSITVDARDYAGNAATHVTRNFKVDTVAPTFTAYKPTDNSNITDNTPWVYAKFADAGTGVNASATTIKVNGTVVTADESTSANVTYECPTALDDGTIPVNVSITDYTGNTTWRNWTFVVDTVAPALGTLDTPTEDQNVSTSTVWINGTYTDATSGVNTSSLVVKVNGTAVSGGTTGGAITSGYYNYSITLQDGDHNVTVDVSDYAGKAATQKLVNFTVDTQAPDVTANPTTYPGSQSAAKTGDTVTLNATVIDTGSGVSSVTVNASTINSTQTSVTLTQVGPTNYYNGTVIVGTPPSGMMSCGLPPSGTMSCAVNATDNCGYSNTSISLSVIVDNTAPSTPVVTDDGASTTSTTQLHANWTSTDSESGIVEYFYAIGNTSGGTEIVDWTSTGTTAEVTRTGLTLTAGQTYYFTVKAQNGAGDNSTAGNSDGITVLTSATTSYDINLVPGWNMVSTPLIPDDPDIGAVLSGMNNVLGVYVYDALNATWVYNVSGFGALTEITAGKGYWFQMSASKTLTIHGTFLGEGGATPPTYPVYTGWNLIGFHSLSADSPYDYLSNVRGDYASKMYGYKNGAWVTVNNADVATGADDLEPGYGYWLYMQQNGTITP